MGTQSLANRCLHFNALYYYFWYSIKEFKKINLFKKSINLKMKNLIQKY